MLYFGGHGGSKITWRLGKHVRYLALHCIALSYVTLRGVGWRSVAWRSVAWHFHSFVQFSFSLWLSPLSISYCLVLPLLFPAALGMPTAAQACDPEAEGEAELESAKASGPGPAWASLESGPDAARNGVVGEDLSANINNSSSSSSSSGSGSSSGSSQGDESKNKNRIRNVGSDEAWNAMPIRVDWIPSRSALPAGFVGDTLDVLARMAAKTRNAFERRLWWPHRGLLYTASAVICAVLSVTILWAELLLPFKSLWTPLGALIGLYDGSSGSSGGSSSSSSSGSSSGSGSDSGESDGGASDDALGVQLWAFFALLYMSVCVFWSLFNLNLGWAYSLQVHCTSPSLSLSISLYFSLFLSISLYFYFFLSFFGPRRYV
jgi:hypothetical protein